MGLQIGKSLPSHSLILGSTGKVRQAAGKLARGVEPAWLHARSARLAPSTTTPRFRHPISKFLGCLVCLLGAVAVARVRQLGSQLENAVADVAA
jgi:hypothetical protein